MLNRFFDALRGRATPPPAAQSAPAAETLPLDQLRARLQRGEAAAVCPELHELANRYPQDPDVLALYGGALFELSVIDQARAVLRTALYLRPDHAEALNTMGAMAAELDDPRDAVGWFEDALEIAPDDLAARYNLAQVLFLTGAYKRGFDLLRARHELLWGRANLMAPMPMWRGESLEGKRLLIWCDWGGLGDHLQFVRYVGWVKERARPAAIYIGAGLEFARLFWHVTGSDGVSAPGHAPAVDVHCPLLDLPWLFGTDLDSVPAPIPYLWTVPAEVAQWGAQLAAAGLSDSQLRVGLAWKSTGGAGEALIYQRMRRSKSIPAPALAALNVTILHPEGGLEGGSGLRSAVRFVSLQMGVDLHECAATGLTPIDCSAGISDFDSTAAVIANLDLVVSADTSVAHLAGAMGKPVLLLLRRESGMFWLHDREDSPWYPSMRILRQSQSGDWAPVLAQAADWLRRAAREGAAVIIPPR
ncbi:MAG TPA: glycosyltransferase family 9 protein [Burkholderiales bacterium]|nr:glycosyltransferase family 9 protein [Burkholderiales bacterium]